MNVETILEHYLIAALWTAVNYDGENLDEKYYVEDFTKKSVAKAREDVQEFVSWCQEDGLDMSQVDDEQIGHDLLLTRQRHGAGFWDRGLGELGETLTDMAHAMGNVDVYECGNGKNIGME